MSDQDTSHHHGVGHIVPPRTLIATAAALLILTVITVWVASYDFGAGNIYVALAIAAIKASLVVAFFMHLKYDRPFNAFVFVVAISFVALFIAFSLTDSREYAADVSQADAPRVVERMAEYNQ